MIVAYPPGGATDILARAVAQDLQKTYGQTTLVENRPGAGGNLGADLVIAGHDHLFERFVPVDASQKRDDAKGIRQLTVGTGGASLYNRSRNAPNSEFLVSTYGMLRLQLDPALYQWTFMDMNGNVLDRGLNVCH